MILLYQGEKFDANFYYQSGITIDHSFLLLNENEKNKNTKNTEKTLFVYNMNEAIARANFNGEVVAAQDIFKELEKCIKGKKIGFDGASISANMAKKLSTMCKLEDRSLDLIQKRAKKTEEEVQKIKRAAQKTREIFELLDFKKAKTELDLKKQIALATVDMGLEAAFEPIVATDESSAYPHYTPENKKLGKWVLIDYGVKYEHYCSDLTRCFTLDGNKKMKSEYETLQNTCSEIIDSLVHAKKGKDVAKIAEDRVKKAGFPKMIHSIGHGVGLDIHELPRLGTKSEDRIAQTVIAIEPAFYYNGKYGMRYEETVYFDGKKAKIL
ncbi:M24 family metallopeptidase [Candidatus Micrarchaeota archaeon]|nr:M24 family metallopeptidase [Candidatus Micrarchaeota archaeon]